MAKYRIVEKYDPMTCQDVYAVERRYLGFFWVHCFTRLSIDSVEKQLEYMRAEEARLKKKPNVVKILDL